MRYPNKSEHRRICYINYKLSPMLADVKAPKNSGGLNAIRIMAKRHGKSAMNDPNFSSSSVSNTAMLTCPSTVCKSFDPTMYSVVAHFTRFLRYCEMRMEYLGRAYTGRVCPYNLPSLDRDRLYKILRAVRLAYWSSTILYW